MDVRAVHGWQGGVWGGGGVWQFPLLATAGRDSGIWWEGVLVHPPHSTETHTPTFKCSILPLLTAWRSWPKSTSACLDTNYVWLHLCWKRLLFLLTSSIVSQLRSRAFFFMCCLLLHWKGLLCFYTQQKYKCDAWQKCKLHRLACALKNSAWNSWKQKMYWEVALG